MKYTVYIVPLLLLLFACGEEPIPWNFTDTPDNLLVVEAIITSERMPQSIQLSHPYTGQNSSVIPASGAVVYITTNEQTPTIYPAVETPAGSGIYLTDSMRAVVGVSYTLVVLYNGQQYTATDTQTFIEPFAESIPYYAVTDSSFTLAFNETGEQPSFTKYNINWQNTGSCQAQENCLAEVYFYDLKNIDINKQIPPEKERVDFPAGSTIKRTKYSVSANFEAYLRGMLSETEWRGGLFDDYPNNPASNVSAGGTGFFAVCTVLSDSTTVQ